MLKRKPTEPDLTRVALLEDIPAVAATATAERVAQVDLEELSAQWTILERRAQSSDRLEQIEAGIALAKLRPSLLVAELKTTATRRASEAARAAARRDVLAANRTTFESRLQAIGERWLAAEREAASALEECNRLAAIIGYGPEGAGQLFEVIPKQLTPGLTNEWRALANTFGGWNL